MATPIPLLKFSARTNTGRALAGGKLYAFASGTATPKATYTTSTGNVQNSHPIILDSRGEADVYLGEGQYSFWLFDSLDNLQYTVNGITGDGSSSQKIGFALNYDAVRALSTTASYSVVYCAGRTLPNDGGEGTFLFNPSSTATDDAGIILTPSSAPATGRWIRQFTGPVNIKWYGATGGGVSNDSNAITNASNAGNSFNSKVYFPSGTYVINSTLTNLNAYFDNGAIIAPSTGVSAIFSCFDGTLNQHFTSGVYFDAGAVNELYPQWFGATGDGVTDDSTAILQCFNSVRRTGGGVVSFPKANYLIAYGYHIPKNCVIKLNGSTLKANTTFCNGTIPTGGTTRAIFWLGASLTSGQLLTEDYDNITVYGDGGTLDGSILEQVGSVVGYSGLTIETTPAPIEANYLRVKNIIVQNLNIKSVFQYGSRISDAENVSFYNVKVQQAGANGISVISGKDITFDSCEASNTRGPNPIDSNYGAGFWHEPNATWQVIQNVSHINCFASYNYGPGFRLWNPGQDAGATITAIGCRSFSNSWDTSAQEFRSSVDSAGFHVSIPTSYQQTYEISLSDCVATNEYQSGFKVDYGSGSNQNANVSFLNCVADRCILDNQDGYQRAAFSVILDVTTSASGKVNIVNPIIISNPTNSAGYLLGVNTTNNVQVVSPTFIAGPGTYTYKSVYGTIGERFNGANLNISIDPGSDNGTGILGSATRVFSPTRLSQFDTSAQPTTNDLFTNELSVWENDDGYYVGTFKSDNGDIRNIPFLQGFSNGNNLIKLNPSGNGYKYSGVIINESNVISGAARINLNGAVDQISTPFNAIGNIAATSGSINAYGIGAPGASDTERILLIHDGNTADVRSLASGSGTLRTLRLVVNATANITCQTNGDVTLGRNLIFSGSSRGVDFQSTAVIRSGTGTPEGVLTAPVGSMFLRSDGGAGTTLYIKESGSGNTGWVAK